MNINIKNTCNLRNQKEKINIKNIPYGRNKYHYRRYNKDHYYCYVPSPLL